MGLLGARVPMAMRARLSVPSWVPGCPHVTHTYPFPPWHRQLKCFGGAAWRVWHRSACARLSSHTSSDGEARRSLARWRSGSRLRMATRGPLSYRGLRSVVVGVVALTSVRRRAPWQRAQINRRTPCSSSEPVRFATVGPAYITLYIPIPIYILHIKPSPGLLESAFVCSGCTKYGGPGRGP